MTLLLTQPTPEERERAYVRYLVDVKCVPKESVQYFRFDFDSFMAGYLLGRQSLREIPP